MATKTKTKKKAKKEIPVAHVYVHSTFNNTIVTFADPNGNVFAWSNAGVAGFKGARKGTPYAAQLAAEDASKKAKDFGVKTIKVFVSGPGAGRESVLRVLASQGFRIEGIEDVTPVPHNGCRPPKRRRV